MGSAATPNLPPTSHPDVVEDPIAELPNIARAIESPLGADSEPDVNAFAEAIVQQMQSKQASIQDTGNQGETQEADVTPQGAHSPTPYRSSTPNPARAEEFPNTIWQC